jgi:translocating chain-associated membrane protein 1
MNKPGRKKNKNQSYFSHEYIIANHGDIVSFVSMIIVLGLMFKITAPLASLFIVMNHNVTANNTQSVEEVQYTNGRYDFFAIFFYTTICIVIHAVIQEYALDKLNRKLHLSKVKHSKFNESGQLCVFYILSTAWAANLIFSEKLLTSLSSLWDGYPHISLPFWGKMFFIIQLSYWVHNYPELYFQKVKKEEIPSRLLYTSLYLCTIVIAYFLNFTRLALALMVIHYPVEGLFHASRLIYFAGKKDISKISFILWNALFVIARVLSATLAYLVFFHGLEKTSINFVSISEGNFNTKIIRLNCFILIIVLQIYLMWNFINFHLRRYREQAASRSSSVNFVTNSDLNAMKNKKKLGKRDDDDLNELPEVDQQYQQKKKKMK